MFKGLFSSCLYPKRLLYSSTVMSAKWLTAAVEVLPIALCSSIFLRFSMKTFNLKLYSSLVPKDLPYLLIKLMNSASLWEVYKKAVSFGEISLNKAKRAKVAAVPAIARADTALRIIKIL